MAAVVPRDRRGPNRRVAAMVAAAVVAGTALCGTGVAIWRQSANGGGSSATVVLATPRPSLDSQASAVAKRVFGSICDVVAADGEQGGAAATGMVIAPSGLVLTNDHVVRDATGIAVQMADSEKWYTATLIAHDAGHDVAVLQLAGASGMATIPVGDSATLAVGDAVVLAGNALGIGGTPDVATGVVSALDQSIGAADMDGGNHVSLDGMIEVQASIQQGDSGGPLMDSSGRVVGMMTAHLPDEDPPLCYSIPIEKVLEIARSLVPSLANGIGG